MWCSHMGYYPIPNNVFKSFYLLLRIVFSPVFMFEPQSVHHTEVQYGHKRSREDCQTKPIKTVGLADPLSWPRVDAVIPIFVISSVHERWNIEDNPKNPSTKNYHLFWYQAKQGSNYGEVILWSAHKSAYISATRLDINSGPIILKFTKSIQTVACWKQKFLETAIIFLKV